jgi:propanediol dehydratase small subunit
MVAKSQILDFGGMTLQVKNIVVGYNRPNTIRTSTNNSVTQITGRTTGVTLNAPSGTITLISAAGSATPASFTVTNNQVAANDTIIVNQKSGTDLYEIFVTAVAAGSFRITSLTTGGTTTESPVFNFNVVKGVA